MIRTLEHLLGVVSARWCVQVEEASLVGLGVGHHLAPLREADDDVVDIEAFVIVVCPAARIVEVARRIGEPSDVIAEVGCRAEELKHRTRGEPHRVAECQLASRRVDGCDHGVGGHCGRGETVGVERRPDEHADRKAFDGVDGHEGHTVNGCGHGLHGVGREGAVVRRIHLAGGAEVKPQTDIGSPRPLAKVDASLTPAAGGIEELLDMLVVDVGDRDRGGSGRRVGQFAILRGVVGGGLIVGGQHLPRETIVHGNERASTIPHAIGLARGVLGVEEVVEVERRLVGVGVTGKAEGIRGQAAVGTTRQVVVVAAGGDGAARGEILLPVVACVANGAELIGGTDPGVEVATRAGAELLQAEVHADVVSAPEEALCLRGSGIVWRLDLAVAGIGIPQFGWMPEIDVERGEGKAGRAAHGAVRDVAVAVAVAVGVKHIGQQRVGVRIDADKSALARDRKEHALVATGLKIDRSGGKALEGFTKAQHAGEVGNRGGKTASADAQELTALTDAEQAAGFILELKARDVADDARGAAAELPATSPRLAVNRRCIAI